MRILIVSFFFPPANAIGAVRAGKLAQYLLEQGHDVRVLTVRDVHLPEDFETAFPSDRVVRTAWLDVNRLPLMLAGNRRPAPGAKGLAGVAARLSGLYRSAVNLPDGQIGWLPWALAAGRRVVRDWRPHLIFATARPFTGLLAAAQLSRVDGGTPFVAELRDLWAGNPYDDVPPWRLRIDAALERHVLTRAAGLVTISETLAADLRRRYGKPVVVVMNGYDPRDYPQEPAAYPDDNKLRLVHTGMIYPGRRDPSVLFEALRRLGPEAEDVRILFYGRLQGNVRNLARRYGVEHLVETPGPLPYRDSLAAQASADVLLLLMWNDPREEGVLTGKLFEYLGARRPILLVGYAGGEAGKLVRERGAGPTLNDPAAIAEQLRRWLDEKRRTGRVAALPETVGQGLTRADQFAALMRFLDTLPGLATRRS